MVKISIITATYNSGKTVRDTLESVLRQDYTNYELIIKDGGSKDDTLKICEEYREKFAARAAEVRKGLEGSECYECSESYDGSEGSESYECSECYESSEGVRNDSECYGNSEAPETLKLSNSQTSSEGLRLPTLRIISCADKGIYDAMNQGIAAATGDVVGLLNSDDFYTSDDILSTINRTFEEHPDIDALYGDIHYVKEDDTSQSVRYYSSKMFRRWWMRFGFMPAHPSFYCRKSTYEKYRKPTSDSSLKGREFEVFDTSYRIAADFDNLLRMIFIGRIKTHYVERDFVTMRMGGASSSGVASHKQINKDHMRSFKENGVYSNYFFISLRYCYKVVEVLMGKL